MDKANDNPARPHHGRYRQTVGLATFSGSLHSDQARARKAIAVPVNGEAVVIIRKQFFGWSNCCRGTRNRSALSPQAALA
jgi:hypothetical protein